MIFLMRHGQTVANTYRILDTAVPGSPLTDLGHEQARAAAHTLLQPPTAVFHGPATRTLQTATELCAALTTTNLTPQAVEGTYEIQAGAVEGQRGWPAFRTYQDMLWAWTQGEAATIPGGETLDEFTHRFQRIIDTLAAGGVMPEGSLLVAHGAAIRMITFLSCHGLGASELLANPLANCEIVAIERTGAFGEWTVHGHPEWLPQQVPAHLYPDAGAQP
ncbi:MAG: histidine phosphatase family protein [Corynebacterium sp.]|nr:histidine phosphatase family protein [Corynebacterium sp.]